VTPFSLYDSLHREKMPFEPLAAGQIGMYLCGPTTYAPAHIGHAYSAIAFDTIRRSLRFLGWTVRYVRNVTDIDDKVINRANEVGEDPLAMSARYTDEYNRDMARFNVLAPDVEPKVTGHIPQIVALIERLVGNGHAYEVDGDVYFEVAKFPTYGALSKQTPDELHAGARVEVDERKRSPVDFALWKSAKPNEPSWDSPWGKGRPGWHIECSAMTRAHLGTTFDIHAGGMDLMFPHHENEIAQSQADAGVGSFARYWMHNGFLTVDGKKMSKSLGNVIGCDEAFEAVGGEAVRLFCVSSHYRARTDFELATVDGARRYPSFEQADRDLAYFYETLAKIDALGDAGAGAVAPDAEKLATAARAALADDFNTPVVVAEMHQAAKLANKLLDEKGGDKARRARTLARLAKDLRAVGDAIGVLGQAPRTYLAERRGRLVRARGIDVAAVEAKVAERVSARAAKDYARGDALRSELRAMGVDVLDNKDGSSDWRVLE
jgi:cysteinyl-tRNA synthetase